MLRDFCARTRVVTFEGRRFVCRPPSVRTIATLLDVLGAEIWALAKSYHVDGVREGFEPDAVLGVLLGGARGAAVLATCVDLHAGAPGELEEIAARSDELQRELAVAVLELCDWRRILDDLSLDVAARATPGAVAGGDDVVSEQELLLCALAERFGCAPHAVAEWPYEAFLTAGVALLGLYDMEKERIHSALAEVRPRPARGGPIGVPAVVPGRAVLRPKARA